MIGTPTSPERDCPQDWPRANDIRCVLLNVAYVHLTTIFLESEDDLYEQIDTLASSRLSHVRTDLSKSQLRMEKENFMCGMRGTSICYSANQRTIMKAHSDLNALRKDEVRICSSLKCGSFHSHDDFRILKSVDVTLVEDALTSSTQHKTRNAII